MRGFLAGFSLIIMVGLMALLSIMLVQSCTSMQPADKDISSMTYPEYEWQHMRGWHPVWSKVKEKGVATANSGIDDMYKDYNPASAVFFDKHEETGMCFAFWGRSFIQAPRWACDKK